jgi:SAM-dependent methyltransferase
VSQRSSGGCAILPVVSPEVESIHPSYGSGDAESEPERFDGQAAGFDGRAGLPADAAPAVARAVLEIAAPGPDGLLLELGAGTGEVGQRFVESIRYVGVDRSGAMLELFSAKLVRADGARVRLLCTDANGRWPVSDGSVDVVFASRAAHLLDAEHLVAELQRVCRPGGYFLTGRVIRDPQGVRSRLRRQRGLLLRQLGIAPRDAEETTEREFGELVARGAVRVQARSVIRWTASASPREILDEWGMMGAMGGKQLSAATRAGVLTDVESWAAHELGDLGEIATWEERYVLEGVRMADHPRSTTVSGVEAWSPSA